MEGAGDQGLGETADQCIFQVPLFFDVEGGGRAVDTRFWLVGWGSG